MKDKLFIVTMILIIISIIIIFVIGINKESLKIYDFPKEVSGESFESVTPISYIGTIDGCKITLDTKTKSQFLFNKYRAIENVDLGDGLMIKAGTVCKLRRSQIDYKTDEYENHLDCPSKFIDWKFIDKFSPVIE